MLCAKELWTKKQNILWWVAPYSAQSNMAQRTLKLILPRGSYRTNAQEKWLELKHTESRCYFKSADNLDALVGEGVHTAILDEAARMVIEAWHNVRTTLGFTRGRAYIISTPRGKTWFYELWRKGMQVVEGQENPEYDPTFRSWNLPTNDNPFFSDEEFQQARLELPFEVFREFYLAEFLEEAAGVFKNFKAKMIGDNLNLKRDIILPIDYVMGVDFAKHRDYSVVAVMDVVTKQVVFLDRFQGVNWEDQLERIANIAYEFRIKDIWVDQTGIGDTLVDFLRKIYKGKVFGYKISSAEAKRQLIMNLQFLFDHGQITMPYLKWLYDEFMYFEYKITGSGRYTYSAASGHHDDGIIAIALAAWGCRRGQFHSEPGYDPCKANRELSFIERLRNHA